MRSAGLILKERREALGLSRVELARRAGVTRQTVRVVEDGHVLRPHRATLSVFARELGLRERDIHEMFEGDE
jgi:transcriptional regulator with XRE-family HTH domain